MFSHAPEGYKCLLCEIAKGTREPLTQPEDVFWKTVDFTAFIGSHW